MSESTTEAAPESPPKRSHHKKKAPEIKVVWPTGESAGSARPPQEQTRAPKGSHAPNKRGKAPSPVDKELRAAMKRLNYAVNPSNVEIFKLAAYQVVQAKLAEVTTLLRLLAPLTMGSHTPAVPSGASAPAARPLTLENIDRMVGGLDAVNAAPLAQPIKNPCQWCGRPGIRKNTRGMWVCQGHLALAVEDDQATLLRNRLAQGFGQNGEEMIHVDAGTIQRAMQNEQSDT